MIGDPELLVRVSRKHIKQGVRGSNCGCPIALSLNEMIQQEKRDAHLCVLYKFLSITPNHGPYDDKLNVVYDLPDSAVEFIKRFDGGWKVFPFEFQAILHPHGVE